MQFEVISFDSELKLGFDSDDIEIMNQYNPPIGTKIEIVKNLSKITVLSRFNGKNWVKKKFGQVIGRYLKTTQI